MRRREEKNLPSQDSNLRAVCHMTVCCLTTTAHWMKEEELDVCSLQSDDDDDDDHSLAESVSLFSV